MEAIYGLIGLKGILAYNIIGTLAYKLCLYFLYFIKYMTFLI